MNLKNLFKRKPKKTREEKAKIFWEWFSKNDAKYLFLNQISNNERDIFLNDFINRLHQFNKNLYFEIGGHQKSSVLELTITAEGQKDYFDEVEFLVEKAPKLDRWEIIAFKPAMGVDFELNYGNMEFDPKKINFIPLENKDNPNTIGICIYYPNYTENKKDIFYHGTILMLEAVLGEKSSILDLHYLEVIKTPENIDEIIYYPLRELQQFIATKKKQPKWNN